MNKYKWRYASWIGMAAVLSIVFTSCNPMGIKKYGLVDTHNGRPESIEMVPRALLGPLPAGEFDSQEPMGIAIMDSGADYGGESSLTYLTNLLERYQTDRGKGDVPAHYFIDAEGVVFTGRTIRSMAEIHPNDPFTLRSNEVTQMERLQSRLNRFNFKPFDLKGYIVIMVLGDYDQIMLNEKQEKSLYQLISVLTFRHYIPRERVLCLKSIQPETKNPGFYLENYLTPAILEKNIPPPPVKHHYMNPPK